MKPLITIYTEIDVTFVKEDVMLSDSIHININMEGCLINIVKKYKSRKYDEVQYRGEMEIK